MDMVRIKLNIKTKKRILILSSIIIIKSLPWIGAFDNIFAWLLQAKLNLNKHLTLTL